VPQALRMRSWKVTETGSSLRANRLRILDTVLESATVFIMNRKAAADPAKREKGGKPGADVAGGDRRGYAGGINAECAAGKSGRGAGGAARFEESDDFFR